jgi:adenosine deaminase
MRPETFRALAERQHVKVPQLGHQVTFDAFGEAIGTVAQVMTTDEDVHRLVGEVVEDAERDGVIWLELSVWPGFLRGRFGTDEQVMDLLLDAGREATRRNTVALGWMLAANRNRGPADAVEMAKLAARLANRGVVSFGLDGDEAAFPPSGYEEAFAIAKDAGLLSSPHAGELLGPESVLSALVDLTADRILHGVRAIEDPPLIDRLASSGVCLDVCPTSNILLGVVPDLHSHPLPALLHAGVRCSLNADDPLLFGAGILDEYELARAQFRLDDGQLAAIARTSIEASGAPRPVAETALRRVNDWLASSPR